MQRISAAGHHKEIASVTSAATYFSVFHGVFTDALETVFYDSDIRLVHMWCRCIRNLVRKFQPSLHRWSEYADKVHIHTCTHRLLSLLRTTSNRFTKYLR